MGYLLKLLFFLLCTGSKAQFFILLTNQPGNFKFSEASVEKQLWQRKEGLELEVEGIALPNTAVRRPDGTQVFTISSVQMKTFEATAKVRCSTGHWRDVIPAALRLHERKAAESGSEGECVLYLPLAHPHCVSFICVHCSDVHG